MKREVLLAPHHLQVEVGLLRRLLDAIAGDLELVGVARADRHVRGEADLLVAVGELALALAGRAVPATLPRGRPEAALGAQLLVGLVGRDLRLDLAPRPLRRRPARTTIATERTTCPSSSSGERNVGPTARRGHCATQYVRWTAPSVR